MQRAVLALGLLLASPGVADATEGDARRGERVFQFCFSCHSVDPNEKAKLQGPNLARIVGRRAGALEGFEYSEALKAQAAAGLVWTRDALDRYITEPEAVIPGGRMSFPGIKDAIDRADVLAYLAAEARAP